MHLLIVVLLATAEPPKPLTIDVGRLPTRPEAVVVEEARARLRQRDDAGALARASSNQAAAAQLIRARVLRTSPLYDLTKSDIAAELEDALDKAAADPVVAPWAALERGHWM